MPTDTDTPTTGTDPDIGDTVDAADLTPESTTTDSALDPGIDEPSTGITDVADADAQITDAADSDGAGDGDGDGLCTGLTVDPALLEIDENVRKSFHLEDHPEVTDSIREHGVLDPILAVRMPDKRLVVRDGQVRTLTALAFELPEVPVYIRDFDPNVDVNEAQIERIFEQITLNDRRIPLTNGDRAAGITQALDLGASVTRVAKALQTKREQVKLVGKVGASPTARRLIDDNDQYDLMHAAIIAKYDNVGDHDAVRRLLNANSDWFDYEANRIAADRAEQRAYLAHALPYAQAGLGILTDYPDLDDLHRGELLRATDIVDAAGGPIDFATIAANPGPWLVWLDLDQDPVWVEIDSGHIIDPDTVDWDTRDQPDAEPADGLRHAREVEQRDQIVPEYFLPREHLDTLGLRERPEPESDDTDTGIGDVADAGEDPDPGQPGSRFGQVDPEQAAAERRAAAEAAAQAAAQAAEIDRAARRRVRELNKLGLAAKATRIEFVTQLLARKTPPIPAALFLTRSLLADPSLIGEYNAYSTALKLLGIEGYRSRLDMLATLDTTKPARAQVIALALVLGGYEHRTDKDLWRYAESAVRRYLTFLRELGYTLVPVELAALGEIKAADIDIDNPTAADDKPAAGDTNVDTHDQDLPEAA
ncbi:ParB N-terminal domain-containing protein [Nocardia puris]|uniref:ParB/RepB/Spo0J family partition protein n=1 Tax=Nocardia puris TaxID=208602 RepID=UPI0018948348|nr:ParB N-terminal domain-containing protein [Nocardia puris]MBF6215927.1 ParB N-terminal domain-containing protein [Nocardia puris]